MITAEMETTGIGSLPHHNIDSALEFSFTMDIPFLPQIPIRNPWEFMLPQALESLPGLRADHDGTVTLDLNLWTSRTHEFERKLAEAFAGHAYEAFEPSQAVCSCWQPFLWELGERHIRTAKIQIAGPVTSRFALRIQDGRTTVPIQRFPEISTQVYRLVLARSLAMVLRLKEINVTPLIFLDEPALIGLKAEEARHAATINELKLMIQTLRKHGATVGLHCCSDMDWSVALSLGLDFLSLDARLSLQSLVSRHELFGIFLGAGGRLALGVIPTNLPGTSPSRALTPEDLFGELMETLKGLDSRTAARVVATSLYTPACGLALHSTTSAEEVRSLLLEFRDFCRRSLRS